MKKFTAVIWSNVQGDWHPTFLFLAKNQKDADFKIEKYLGYQNMGKDDGYARPALHSESLWPISYDVSSWKKTKKESNV